MGKRLKDLRAKRDALIYQKEKHILKIKNALESQTNLIYIDHWLTEIENFEIEIKILNAKICNHKK